MGEGVEGGPPRAAMAAAMGARGELSSGRERGWRELGQVEEGVKLLTLEGIEPRRLDEADRWVVCPMYENRGNRNWSEGEDGRRGWTARRAR